MKRKVVIRVPINCPKSRSRAMKIAVGASGVESAALQGEDHDQIEVIGEEIDTVKLTLCLRKKMGFAEVLSVSPVVETKAEETKTEEKKEETAEVTIQPLVWTSTNSYPYQYNGGVYQIYEVGDHHGPFCPIM